MKKSIVIILAIITVFSLTACKSSLEVSENTGKSFVIDANNSAKDDSVSFGSLTVDTNEYIVIASNFKKGSVKIEFFKEEEPQSIDKVPSYDGEPALTAMALEEGVETNPVKSGTYYVKVTTEEKAKGKVTVSAEKTNK